MRRNLGIMTQGKKERGNGQSQTAVLGRECNVGNLTDETLKGEKTVGRQIKKKKKRRGREITHT